MLVYRFLTMVPTIVIGLVSTSMLRRRRACLRPGGVVDSTYPDEGASAMAMDDGSFGGRTWLKMFAILIGIGIAVILVFVFISNSIAKWGFLGGFIVIGAVLLVLAWLFDKREAKKNAEWGLPE